MEVAAIRSARGSYAFVLPRYGAGIAGGAETLAGELAKRLALRGDKVEILTTCARDNRTWDNYFPPGRSVEDGVTVQRFPVDERNLDKWIPLQIGISQGLELPLEDQLVWMEQSVNSAPLYAELVRRAENFDRIFFAPYLFGTTFWGSLAVPERACLIPCLHDEHYAYTDVIASMFRQVSGFLFNAKPEQELAERLFGRLRGGEVGKGFEPWSPEARSRLKPYFKDSFPYLLYLGRKETGKNAHLLIDLFCMAKDSGGIPDDMTLVVAGGGSFEDLHRPEALKRGDIVDIAHVSEEEKHRLIRHAVCLVQPSVNESFSIVLMEAWLLGTPCLVHAQCDVTRYHVVASGGGLYFSDLMDFSASVRELTEDTELGKLLGSAGERYVLERYNWEEVLSRFDKVMSDLSRVSDSV